MKIRKGDTVLVARGKDKGKQGNVLKAMSSVGKVMVEGVNQYKKHIKKNASKTGSEIITLTRALPVETVALICPKCKKQTRVGYKFEKDLSAGRHGRKFRICKKCGKEI